MVAPAAPRPTLKAKVEVPADQQNAALDQVITGLLLRRLRQSGRRYTPAGTIAKLWEPQYRECGELVLVGPAGTGKSRAIMEWIHEQCQRYPGIRVLLVRKRRVDLAESVIMTFQNEVLTQADLVSAYGGETPRFFRYPNRSRIVTAGLDKPGKVMSAQYDLIYPNEATELTENDWESLTTRLRNGMAPFQQLVADTNPDRPTHWLKARIDAGRTTAITTTHEDNPRLYDQARGEWTPEGRRYVFGVLDKLTGHRLQRLRYGRWAAAEGMVYEDWDPDVHLLDWAGCPPGWQRLWSVDFGYTHPLVFAQWAIDEDRRMYLERELYVTHTLVEDAAAQIRAIPGLQRPVAVICDHDAEDRATLERHLKVKTTPAYKAISPGLQAVQSRLRVAEDGRPRLYVLRSASVTRDERLVEQKKPTSFQSEIEGYTWDTEGGRRRGERPVDRDDHSLDQTRYAVAWVDRLGEEPKHKKIGLVTGVGRGWTR